MKNLILATGAVVLALTIGCSNPTTEEQPIEETTQQPVEQEENTFSATDDAYPVESTPIEQSFEQSPVAPAGNTARPGAKLNPPHGEPGHRCEIAVGDPLPDDGAPAPVTVQSPPPQNMQIQSGGQTPTITQSPAPMATPTPAPTSIMTTPAPSGPSTGATPPGMNPPHGEPGHDCAVPVGSPLPNK